MGSAALKPSIAVGRLFRNRRHEMRLTLRDVSERMEEMGERFPTSTLIRVEQGKLDPGVRRLHLLMKLYRIPLVIATPSLCAVGAAQVHVDPPPIRYLRSMGSLGRGWLKAALVDLGLMRRKRRRGKQA